MINIINYAEFKNPNVVIKQNVFLNFLQCLINFYFSNAHFCISTEYHTLIPVQCYLTRRQTSSICNRTITGNISRNRPCKRHITNETLLSRISGGSFTY